MKLVPILLIVIAYFLYVTNSIEPFTQWVFYTDRWILVGSAATFGYLAGKLQ